MPPAKSSPRSGPRSYWSAVRAARYSLTFALPLLLAYEGLAFLLTGSQIAGVRNGADVLLKSLFTALGGRYGLTIFSAVLLGTGAVLIFRDRRKNGPIEPSYFLGMLGESVIYAVLLGTVASTLTSLLLGRLSIQGGAITQFGFPTQIMISLGAGIYEELVFRVLLVSGTAWLAKVVFGWGPRACTATGVLVGALIFSAFHYIGQYGDPFELSSFLFRAIAGLLFSLLYVARGFGIAAWSHALYDVMLAIIK
ncbi:MAG: CPBP family intramembrane glutamic endopeptidase [Gemmatimonadota bacterium]